MTDNYFLNCVFDVYTANQDNDRGETIICSLIREKLACVHRNQQWQLIVSRKTD